MSSWKGLQGDFKGGVGIKNPDKPKKVYGPPKKVGKKKGSICGLEAMMFKEVWDSRPHKSELTGKHIIEPCTYCFAHVLPKGLYPEYRLDPNNIILVSSIEEHEEIDKLSSGIKDLLDVVLRCNRRITVKHLQEFNKAKGLN